MHTFQSYSEHSDGDYERVSTKNNSDPADPLADRPILNGLDFVRLGPFLADVLRIAFQAASWPPRVTCIAYFLGPLGKNSGAFFVGVPISISVNIIAWWLHKCKLSRIVQTNLKKKEVRENK